MLQKFWLKNNKRDVSRSPEIQTEKIHHKTLLEAYLFNDT